MADEMLFILDAEARWRLAYDANQWVLQQRRGKARASHIEGRSIARSGYEAVSFVGSTKATLARVLGEKGVPLTAEAQARLDALPERFKDFAAAPDGLDVAA